jgi:hypothetical protein
VPAERPALERRLAHPPAGSKPHNAGVGQSDRPGHARPPRLLVVALALVLVFGLVTLGIVLSRNHERPAAGAGAAADPSATRRSPTSAPGAVRLQPTDDWQTASPPGTRIEGFADRTSVLPGRQVHLRVSATGTSFTVSAFRMGSYGGAQAATAWHGGPFPVVAQPHATELPATRTVTTSWKPTVTVTAAGWPPGAYLLRLQGSDGAQGYVPLTVRSPTTAGRIVIIQAVTDWQAYNDWGGLSLYHGRDGQPVHRSYAVSFDRPYAGQAGAGDFLGNEVPLITFAERLRLPVAYATDIDLHEDPHLLDGAVAVVSPGHDEYYSSAMRAALTAARDAGTNLVFLGANAVYRHVRLASTARGPDRLEIDYKDSSLDPMTARNPAESTSQWRSPPGRRPESELIGGFYQCNPTRARLVVAPRLSWLTAGMGLKPGQSLGVLVGPEYDRVDLSVRTPHPLQVLFHSPLRCTPTGGGFADASDVTYYSEPSGAGVFDSGTSKWECALSDTACGPGWGDAATYRVVREVTRRLLEAAAAGPMGRLHPAVDTTGGAPGPRDGIGGIPDRNP